MNNNGSVTFVAKGFASILIGIYFLLGAYFIKSTINNLVTTPHSPTVFSDIYLIVLILFTVLLCCSLTLFIFAKKLAKERQVLLYNISSKKTVTIYTIGIILLFLSSLMLFQYQYFEYVTPVFLLLYALWLLVMKNKLRKDFKMISILCFFLAIICFLIPSYWYSSLSLLGIAHITYGVITHSKS
ncbi:hypothetical protein DUT90_02540 [Polaribacter sp. WD7]|uniref:hypothetical protein n=1 Tax=Polaribacter sp. WD7 TaxID=2269061 RepID=UPI000DF30314|nr:hypothetical protein [Polaribacter sp. WD7]RCS28201.1 hypothetical protein DUT90_02540 [Polaribacter sp. WD7]